MIFANVKDWTITEGAVKMVTDSLGRVIWKKQTTPSSDYFYVEDASGANNTLFVKKNVGNSAPTIGVYYSTDQVNWSFLGNTSTTALTLNIPANGKVYLKATTNYWTVFGANNNNWINCYADFNIGGNIMSLIAGDNFQNANLVDGTNDYAFSRLFENNYLVDASKLVLPNTVSSHCYEEMFYICHNLLTAPALPATTLANYCYYWMFYGCTSLTTAPALPATTLANRCYDSMFFSCSSLTSAPALPATTLADYCYALMFRGCTSLTTAPALPATTLADYCYQSMFTSTAITTAPDLPATTLTEGCYSQMFSNCSNLNYIKIYADDITASNCLASWVQNVAATGDFYNEGSATYPVNSASGIPTGWTEHKAAPTAEYFYVEDISGSPNTLSIRMEYSGGQTIEVFSSTDQTNWTSMGSTSTTAITATVPANGKLYLKCEINTWYNNYPNMITCSSNFNIGGHIMSLLVGDNFENATITNSNTNAFNKLFIGSTTLTNTNDLILPSTVYNSCYQYMFSSCTGLTTAPVLPATTLESNCYFGMFSGCTSLTTAPALPATTLAKYCCKNMFSGCTSLTTAPTTLSATTLAQQCYYGMFANCTSLTTAPVLPVTTLAKECYRSMFNGCTSLNSVTTYADDISASNCINNWLNGVAAIGTFHNLGTATYPSGASGIPSGWTEVHN